MSSNSDSFWHKDAVIYQVHVKTFCDSNGDGVGDFKGLTSKLDYIQSLGTTLIWVMPFYPSPLKDDGYDISDYKAINPRYGTLEDFKEFLNEAHKRGIKVLTELVLNHTSDQHEWFQKARKAKPGDPARDFYVWSDTKEKYKDARIIFFDYEDSNWQWDDEAKAYYWHRFFRHQPDLNYDNPEVFKAMLDVVDFWLEMGVDGFRFDAARYLVERDGTLCDGLPETHTIMKKIRKHVDQKYPNRALLGEVDQKPKDIIKFFGDNDEMNMLFHFPVMPRMYLAMAFQDKTRVESIIKEIPPFPKECQWATFLRNHDELALEMVSKDEWDRMLEIYCPDPRGRVASGIVRRLAPLMANDRKKIEAINMMLFSLPGSPIVYYGDEIGMGSEYLHDRDGVRTPMQWNEGKNAGFSAADASKLILPIVSQQGYTPAEVNVEKQEKDKNSLLNWTRHILKVRKTLQVFGRGDINFVAPENKAVLAFTRSYEKENVLVLINLADRKESVKVDLSNHSGKSLCEIIQNKDMGKTSSSFIVELEPYGYRWIKIG
jgi:maltose alpha-D-glucosyltransferase/alpha-amylase